MNNMSLGIVLFVILILIVVFLVCREIVCWYWKINEMITLMREQNELLKKIILKNIIKGKENADTSPQLNDIDSETPIDRLDKNTIDDDSVPNIISKQTRHQHSVFSGAYEEYILEYEDGTQGSIFEKTEKNEFYFKNTSGFGATLYYYDSYANTSSALYTFLKKGIIQKKGHRGTFDKVLL